MNTDEIRAALRRKYPGGEYAVLEEVRNGAGFDASRSADAIIMGLWPSRGLELWGVEIKADRRDFLRELKNPRKAEEIAAYCDRWFVAIGDESVCQIHELPPKWGLIRPGPKGELAVAKQGELQQAKVADRSFLAALLKRAQQTGASVQQIRAAVAAADEAVRKSEKALRAGLERDYAALCKRVEDFEIASGVKISDPWSNAKNIGAAVRAVVSGDHIKGVAELKYMEARVENILRGLREAITAAGPVETVEAF